MNKNPEQEARDKIDKLLTESGWIIQDKSKVDFSVSIGVAVREYQTDVGFADYMLFVNRIAVGVIEAKREDMGENITRVEEQSKGYATANIKYVGNKPLPFTYESTGILTRFTDHRDPKPRSRLVFSFHRPETLEEWFKQDKTLRGRFRDIPELNHDGLRPAQITAIENLEHSFRKNRPRALIQMATGAGKTFTATTFIYRLLKYAKAKRILFLVDTRNLGEQAEQEFFKYQPQDDNRKFTELYNVQRLSSSYITPDNQVYISTIQRLYSILKGEELDESSELSNPNESSWMDEQLKKKEPMPVVYNAQVPIEQFDFIIIDECHRSIYNLWKQVLDYFDAFLIGLTATPDKRTFGFFNENVVSEYTYEASVADGVNVPYDVYMIETEISQKGDTIQAGWSVERRDKLTRQKRWNREDEETAYSKSDLDRKVVNPSQIRNIIREFKQALKRDIFPDRMDENGEYEVPKTLIFAKTDSHADDIINIAREEFDEGNEFCKKVTYKIDEDPKTVLNRFRNSYYPRIAVTVDMIATGTDVKPLEVLLFMRDVKSLNYFEQMKGRGTRTINKDELQLVSKTAPAKTHFVIVDAVGATKSKKTDSRPLERKRSVPLKDLLDAVTMGVADEDLFLSLANRLIRLDKQLSESEQEKVTELSGGKNLKQLTKDLLSAHDPDVIQDRAKAIQQDGNLDKEEAEAKAREALEKKASISFNGKLNEHIETVRRNHEQIIDHLNLDSITRSEWDKTSLDKAKAMVSDFSAYIEDNRDEIKALSIFYNEPYRRKEITFRMIKELFEKLKQDRPLLMPLSVWQAYEALDEVSSKDPLNELTALVALVRKVSGIDAKLTLYSSTVDENFRKWIFKQNAGQHNRFSEEQTQWLRMIKEHIVSSFHMDMDDLDYTPFDSLGGRGQMYRLFGDEMNMIIDELNEALVA